MKPSIIVEFYGPFSWHGLDETIYIFDHDLAQRSGVYLWTVKHQGLELVFYVGETGRSFVTRMYEHYTEQISGGYSIYDPDQFKKGKRVLIWPGRYGSNKNLSISDFLIKMESSPEKMFKFIKLLRFWLAPLEVENRIRERIEAGIAKYLQSLDGYVGDFQDKEVRYRGRSENEPPILITISSPVKIAGLPETLWI